MQNSVFDRVIAAVSPSWDEKRQLSRMRVDALRTLADIVKPETSASAAIDVQALGQPSGSAGRWWRPQPRDAKSDTLRFLPNQRGASRELARTSPIAVGAINTNIDRIVGTGLAFSAQPNRAVLGWSVDETLAWKSLVQREFSLWADSTESDISQTLNFYQQQGLVLRSGLESGDCFTLLPDGERTKTQPYALRIQVLEADRVGNPSNQLDTNKIAGGVRINDAGAPDAYFVYDQHPGGWWPGKSGQIYAGQWIDRVGKSGRRRILHHYRKLRPEMPRGAPYLAPIIDCIKQISRYTNAEIMAAVVTSYLTVFIETPTGNSPPIFDGKAVGNYSQEVELGMGAVVPLMPGEKVQILNPGRPNPNFDPFITAVIKQIAIALSLPPNLLMKQFDASYSASKAALLDAAVYFRNMRSWLSLSFCQPVFETWLAEAVAIGRVPAIGFFSDPLLRWAYTRAAWPGDSMGSINPKDEVSAYVAAIDARLMTRERAEWELWGSDFDATFDQKVAEQRRLKSEDMLPMPKAGAAAPQTQNDQKSSGTSP